jgi:hypothetical protein
MDLSGNAFQGAFPTALISQAEAAQTACANMCSVRVLLGGADMSLACPGELRVSQEQLAFLQQEDYTCSDGSGQQVRPVACHMLSWLVDALVLLFIWHDELEVPVACKAWQAVLSAAAAA